MNYFHAHIYFSSTDLTYAQALKGHAVSTNLFSEIKLHESAVGPHPTGMLELHFNQANYEPVITWIESQRADRSVLVHQDTGDDVKDHTNGIRWLGQNLTLNFDFFEQIKSRPELRVHQ
ncbi:MAG: 4,5-dioxygenase [Bdellovibrio sp.]|nr:4,5-dioxygenase [Bdellovibrio sp.]